MEHFTLKHFTWSTLLSFHHYVILFRGVNGPRKFKRSFSTRIKVFRSTTVREYLHERDRLKRLQHVANVEDNQNPLSLLKVLLNSQSTPPKAKGRSSRIDEISRAFLKFLKFVFRVVLVMGVLYTAAVLFAYLEDQAKVHIQRA